MAKQPRLPVAQSADQRSHAAGPGCESSCVNLASAPVPNWNEACLQLFKPRKNGCTGRTALRDPNNKVVPIRLSDSPAFKAPPQRARCGTATSQLSRGITEVGLTANFLWTPWAATCRTARDSSPYRQVCNRLVPKFTCLRRFHADNLPKLGRQCSSVAEQRFRKP